MHFPGLRKQIVVPLFLLLPACGSGVTTQDGAAATSASTALSKNSARGKEAAVSYRYEIVDVPGATRTRIWAINDLGVVVGDISEASGDSPAFLRTPNGTVTTVTSEGAHSTLRGINDLGISVGFFAVATPQGPNASEFHGFIRMPGGGTTQVDYPGAPDSALLGINNRGELVGQYDLGDQSVGGSFILDNGKYTNFVDPPGSMPFNVFAQAANDPGLIVGSFIGSDGIQHAFVLKDGIYTTFDVPGSIGTVLVGVNDRGQAVGVADSGGFVLDTATMTISASIACPGGFSFPNGINNRGQVAGTCKFLGEPGPAGHGFIATPVDD